MVVVGVIISVIIIVLSTIVDQKLLQVIIPKHYGSTTSSITVSAGKPPLSVQPKPMQA